MKYRAAIILSAGLALLLLSCNSVQTVSIARDFGGAVSFSVKADEAVSARLRKFQGLGPATLADPFFSADMVRAGLAKTPGATVMSMLQNGPSAISGTVVYKDVRKAFAPASGMKPAVTVTEAGDVATLTVSLDRANARSAMALFPGLDPAVMEALAPPALEGQAMTEAEYEEMLESVLGKKVMPALKAAEYRVTLSLPGKVVSARGGTVAGNSVSFSVPVLKALVLESPVDFSVTWQTK